MCVAFLTFWDGPALEIVMNHSFSIGSRQRCVVAAATTAVAAVARRFSFSLAFRELGMY